MSRFGNLEFDGEAESPRPAQVIGDEARHLGEAEAAFRRGDFEQALRSFARVVEANPQSAVAWVGQVRMLIELGYFQEAGVWASKALEQFPSQPELLAAKAVTLARTGDLRGALAMSDAAIVERGDTPYVWLARGDVLLARKEKRADYCFTKVLAAAPRDWLWPWLASRVHAFYRKFSLALKLAGQALALDAAQAVIWVQLARCQRALGLTALARESFTQAGQLDAHCPLVMAATLEAPAQSGLWEQITGAWRRWRRG
jgi:tetratricopeptide (TPR) repeat protein